MQPAEQVEVPQHIVNRCIASLIEAFRCITRYSEQGALEEWHGVALVKTGIPFPMFNPMFITKPPQDM